MYKSLLSFKNGSEWRILMKDCENKGRGFWLCLVTYLGVTLKTPQLRSNLVWSVLSFIQLKDCLLASSFWSTLELDIIYMMINNILTSRLFRQIRVFWKNGMNHIWQRTTSAPNENDFELYISILLSSTFCN